jgi:hypothetical protein
MKLNKDSYVPAIRWRQGEYQGIFRLTETQKNRITPWITIPDIEFDFEEWEPKCTIDEHISPFARRFKAKWGSRPAWISLCDSICDTPLADGSNVLTTIFNSVRENLGNAIPAIKLNSSSATMSAAKEVCQMDKRGFGIILSLEDLMSSDITLLLTDVVTRLNVSIEAVDLIVDLGAPAYEPYSDFSEVLFHYLNDVSPEKFRNFIVVGTSIPESFKDIAKGRDEIVRHDWNFYKELHPLFFNTGIDVVYGDYTIVHPKFSPQDMRKLKPAGKLVYTGENSWIVYKGGSFRDNPGQMHDHCQKLVSTSDFRGASFSYGDNFIVQCAQHAVGPSSQSNWKGVSINHHISQALDDLAKFFSST